MKLPNTQMARGRRQHTSTILIRSIVIALCSVTVITTTVQSSSIGASSTDQQQPSQQAAPAIATQEANEAATASVAKQPKQADQVAASASPAEQQQAKPSEPSAKSALDSSLAAEQTRKGRSEAPPLASSEPAAAAAKTSSQPGAPEATKSTSKPAPFEQKPAAAPSSSKQPAASSASSQTKQQQLAGKSGSSSSSSFSSSSSSASKKLPANLGTVTSTGSGGPAHYMSKHDAYSAIAEKHGALAQDAMRKADKRNHNLQRFSGIQKASGFSDALNPFKTVTDGGLARTLGASMRSIMKGKYSIPAYVASAVLGAVALMAFYESPISPLPVPALPEPPVGRFPPEMPVISPNLQVPFRMNQQQQQQQYGQQYGQQNGYGNQRSFQTTGNLIAPASNQQQQQQPNQDQPQQVLFPGATAQSAQQRQGVAAPGPVQQLAANLISSVGANRQTAQRKSGPDSDSVSSSRSFFGSSAQLNTNNNKLSAPANQQQHHKPSGVSSMFSFLGLGGSGSGSASSGNQASSSGPGSSLQASLGGLGDVHRASGLGSQLMAAAGTTGHDISSSLSNSHLVNKMKSYFDRPVPHNSWSMDHNQPNQYDQYRRMSIMQALAKDTAFLSSFFSPSRRSSNSTSASSGPANSIQQSINAVLSGASGSSGPTATPQVASSRMQVDHVTLPGLMSAPFGLQPVASGAGQQQQQPAPAKRASSGYGLMRAADRITHALLDTFTSGLLHRSSESTTANSKKAAAALDEQQQQQNALASATSILSDIMSSYNTANQASAELNNQQQQQQQHASQMESAAKQQATAGAAGSMGPNGNEQASGRSADLASSADKQSVGEQSAAVGAHAQQQAKQQQQAVSEQQQAIPQQQQQQPLNRKVRSIGLDYPMEPVQQQQQQQQQQPSRATQINSLVDYVSDSYKQNKLLFSFVMNQVGLSQALPYVEQFLGNPNESKQ